MATAQEAQDARREGRLGPAWVGRWPLGSGSFGKCFLFAKQNPQGRIMEYVAMKDCLGGSMWDAPELWTHWGGRDDTTSIPNEIQSLYNLRGQNGSNNIVDIRNFRINRARRFYRQYLEFCPLGDLEDVVLAGSDYFRDGLLRRGSPNVIMYNAQTVPEPFLWSAFLDLATAGVLLERGTLGANTKPDWEVIVHRDMKLANVFMGHGNQRFRGYPSLKLADFGLAVMMPPDNPKIAEDYGDWGTPGHRAPEQDIFIPDADGTSKMMSSKTNVWTIGIVMWSLVACYSGAGLHLNYNSPDPARKMPPPFDATAKSRYSAQLLDLIEACLAYDPENRPGDLLDQVLSYTGSGDLDLAEGLRDAPLSDPKWQTHQLTRFQPDGFRMGVFLSQLGQPAGGFITSTNPPTNAQAYEPEEYGGETGGNIDLVEE